jgi:hypothetical protein
MKLISDLKAKMEALQKEGQDAFKAGLKEFFDEFPEVTAIQWYQYTPYFNDGDECVFRVGEPAFYTGGNPGAANEYDEEDYEPREGEPRTFKLGRYDWGSGLEPSPELRRAADELSEAIQSDEFESILLALFDNHVTVTATPNSITTTGYSHD